MSESKKSEWWRGGVMYQVYPRSFKDSAGKGHGDLKGVTEKLDYLADLGIDGIWLSPFFKSPMKDYGYDVSDYCAVDPSFGTMEDFRALLDKAHSLNIKIIVDIVLNHTSEQHPWFLESRMSKDNPKSDWYVWKDPNEDGTPPNNWLSIFGGPAWQFSPLRGQYYLRSFLKEQPDLNYHNPEVVEAMLAQCRFWLEFGVDGFRLDVVNFCGHDKEFKNNPPRLDGGMASQLEIKDAYAMQWHHYDKTRPENMAFVRKLRALLDEYPDKMSLAEIGDDNAVKVAAEYTAAPDLLHTAYSFALMANKGHVPPADFFRRTLEAQMAEPGDSWPAWAMSNHDVTRVASRWSGTDYSHDPRLSKMLIALLTTLRGTPFIYQGEELGLPEMDVPYEKMLDEWGKYLYPAVKGRDGCRTPMPWANDAMVGFTKASATWLPINEDHRPLNVAQQSKDANSPLVFTRAFLHWRRGQESLITGDIEFQDSGRDDVLLYKRGKGADSLLCAFNLSLKNVQVNGFALEPYEARFIRDGKTLFSSAVSQDLR